jgi:hypothetical protein
MLTRRTYAYIKIKNTNTVDPGATSRFDLDVKDQSSQFYAFAGQHIGRSGRVFKG